MVLLVREPFFCYTVVMSRLQKFLAYGLLLFIPVVLFAAEPTVTLVQPLDDSTTSLEIGDDLAIIVYFETFAPYFYTVAVGFCTIWVVIGGIMVMVSKGGQMKDSGKDMIQWSIIALLILTFGGFVLRTLNSVFFQ